MESQAIAGQIQRHVCDDQLPQLAPSLANPIRVPVRAPLAKAVVLGVQSLGLIGFVVQGLGYGGSI